LSWHTIIADTKHWTTDEINVIYHNIPKFFKSAPYFAFDLRIPEKQTISLKAQKILRQKYASRNYLTVADFSIIYLSHFRVFTTTHVG